MVLPARHCVTNTSLGYALPTSVIVMTAAIPAEVVAGPVASCVALVTA